MDRIREVSEELNQPSADKLYRVMRSRDIPVSRKEIVEFVKGLASRQVQAPPYKFEGKIASSELNDRWFADLIDFTAAPSDGGAKTSLTPTKDGEKYVLCVQDVFSRKLYTRAMTNKKPETIVDAFNEILKETGTKPKSVTSDLGAEFGQLFQKALQNQGIDTHQKEAQDKNAIATLDVAIGNLKKAMARDARTNKTNDWAGRLEKVTRGQNNIPNDAYLEGVAPNKVAGSPDLRGYLREKNAAFTKHNQMRIEKRDDKLTKAGAFRVADQKGKFARGHKPGWSTEIHHVESVRGATVADTKGNKFLTKFTLPVSGTEAVDDRPAKIETGGSDQTEAKKRKHLQPWAERVVKYIDGTKDKSLTLSRLGTMLKDQPDFRKAALESGISMKTPVVTFLRVYPELYVLNVYKKEWKVSLKEGASRRPTETLAPFLK